MFVLHAWSQRSAHQGTASNTQGAAVQTAAEPANLSAAECTRSMLSGTQGSRHAFVPIMLCEWGVEGLINAATEQLRNCDDAILWANALMS